MFELKFSKVLGVINCVLLLILSVLGTGCSKSSNKLSIKSSEQPTIGNADASVHVVVFEEPKCPGCKKFSTLVFPLLKQDYIDTNLVLYSLVPVSFVSNSMNAAEAWLCVYHQDKNVSGADAAFKYVDYTYANQPAESTDWATIETLLDFAKNADSKIDLESLKTCLNKHTYRSQIEKNTEYGMKLMNGELATPGVYVNGIQLEDVSYENLEQRIKEELKKKAKG
jgi:protein-disulfide isomerase